MATSILALLFFFILTRCCFKRRVGVDTAVQEDPFSGGPRGVDPSVIESFPTFTYSTPAEGKKVCRGMNVCVICLAVFKGGETLRFMPRCRHVFHSGCVDSWLKTHSTCPCCRACLVNGPNGSGWFFSRLFWPNS
uniref:RING-type E3 ubiquitin transferase n=1 Tax=Chenopodium quinoa TaxID=63459 RepID=A0A803KPC4_CHEQI